MPSENEIQGLIPIPGEVLCLLRDLLTEVRAVRDFLETYQKPEVRAETSPLVRPRETRPSRDRVQREYYLTVIDECSCPRCEARPGEDCRTPRDQRVWPPHGERLDSSGRRNPER